MTPNNLPASRGFYFPAEWHSHQATWLSWPHNPDTWPGGIEEIYPGYLHFVEEISKSEDVCMVVSDRYMEKQAKRRLSEKNINPIRVKYFHHPTNDAWCRDHGPCFLINAEGGKMIVDWEYNAWGAKYPPYHLDNAIPGQIANDLGLRSIQPGLVLEGGSVDFNGAGTVLTTSSCLLNPNRNQGVAREQIEQSLKDYFAVKQVLWLDHGIVGDDTDGHIDTIARFVAEDEVVAVVEDDPLDENYRPLKENFKALTKMKLISGRPLRVHTLPMPQPKFNQGQRLPASYANFYICNTSVLVPTYNDPNDQQALSILAGLFSNRKVVGIDASELIRGLGSLHCLCMQEPLI